MSSARSLSAVPRPTIRRQASVLLLASAAAALPGLASAAGAPARPGLWEVESRASQLDSVEAKLQERVAKLPPDRRAQVEADLRGRVGPTGPTKQKVCVTPETLRRGAEPERHEGDCVTRTKWSGNTGRIEMACTDGRHGTGEFVYDSPERYKGWMEMKNPANLRASAGRIEITGRRLGDDCGDVKPILPPAAKAPSR